MPAFRKLNTAETAALEQSLTDTYRQIAREYDAHLAGFVPGDYGRAELHAGEERAEVRVRLQAAAERRGLQLRFRPGRGPLTFHVASAPAVEPAAPTHAKAAPAVAQAPARDEPPAERQPQPTSRPPRRRLSATERYREVLPRWMRDGGQAGRRGESKRRPR
jgi:hypothetical protein